MSSHHHLLQLTLKKVVALFQPGMDESALMAWLRAQVDGKTAGALLETIASHEGPYPPTLVRALQCLACTARPIQTEFNGTHYEWAGTALQRLFKSSEPISEFWPFFSGSQKPAVIAGTALEGLGYLTLEHLVSTMPEVLGPAGADPEHHQQKYFFVKFLDPSDFPPFAYVGFNPDTVGRLGMDSAQFAAHLCDQFGQDRASLEALAELVRPRVTSPEAFAELKRAYKQWAIAQAQTDWAGETSMHLDGFVASRAETARAETLLRQQQTIRRHLVSLLHRIDYADDQAILIETPTLHAIAGLSLQVHPRIKGNFYPKDELWIYKRLTLPDGGTGWILVEPQRTFDKTESGGDFFTPFAWHEGRLGFRKAITPASLKEFVSLIDLTPRPRDHYLRTAAPARLPGETREGQAAWYRTVDEPAWPYFRVQELRFAGPGRTTIPLEHHTFIELHATEGQVRVELQRGETRDTCVVRPGHPALLPASLPYDMISYRADGPAQLQVFSRPKVSDTFPRTKSV